MLAFAEGCRGERTAVSYDAGAVNLTAYGTADANGATALVIVNKDERTDAVMRIAANPGATQARVLRLATPLLDSKAGVTLGGAAVGQDGQWRGRSEDARVIRGVCGVHVPAASAAIVKLQS
jgi:hypothetical protein